MEYETSLKDKTIIVTGSNCGIGYEAALDFAKRGARVILACRNQAKADIACEKIKEESKNEKVEVELIDLSSLKSTREFIERIKAKLDRLDILVNNAGLSGIPFSKTDEGFEIHFVANYLAHYLLTRELLDLLKKSAPSRIINVSSAAYKMGPINWDDLNYEKNYSDFKSYGQSKLAQILFTRELEKRLKETGISAVSLHPGVVITEIWRKRENQTWLASMLMSIFRPLVNLFGKSTSDGAKTTIHCATSDDIPSQSGSYFVDSKVEALLPLATDKEAAERLWKISADLVGLEE